MAFNNFDGIELWNQFSVWVERLESWFSYINILFPRRLTTVISPELLKRWDNINLERFVFGTGGVDAHTIPQRIFFWTKELFPLKVELKGVRQHFYIPAGSHTPQEKDELLRQALVHGNGFTSNYRRGDARGAKIYFETTTGEIYPPGIAKHCQFQGTLRVRLPLEATIRVIRNGKVVMRENQVKTIDYTVETPGSYRIEVRRHGFGWIYSNHFALGEYPFD